MMSDRNWGYIRSGATFESLVRSLIRFEDSGAYVFGRTGPDAGQDARSSDGKTVFQIKYHQVNSAAKAIRDAKEEAEKISRYLRSEDPRKSLWEGVTRWRLVTNATFNPKDLQRWKEEVAPLFQEQDLSADYWGQADLSVQLDKYPEIDRSYFQHTTRALLSLPEAVEVFLKQEPFIQHNALGSFVGRDPEMQEIQLFLESDRLFLVINGAGGIGKTRIAIEAGKKASDEGSWQVLWANIASMEQSGEWFEGIIPETPTVLIVDEPENEQLLRSLSEQLYIKFGRMSKWKIILTVRSSKDPVFKFLYNPRMQNYVKELPIPSLFEKDAESMCINLIEKSSLDSYSPKLIKQTGKMLAKNFSCHPIWLTLAVHVLAKTGNLREIPQTAIGLVKLYLEEIINQQNDYSSKSICKLFRMISLFGALDRSSDSIMEFVREYTQMDDLDSTRKALEKLVKQGVLIKRGAYDRLVEMKPDVLRDHVLLQWLPNDVDFGTSTIELSNDAKLLIQKVLNAASKGELGTVEKAILKSLARTELLLQIQNKPLALLDIFVRGICEKIDKIKASSRIALAEIFVEIAELCPESTVQLSKIFRISRCESEKIKGFFGDQNIDHKEVLLGLAWPVLHAALGAQSSAIREKILTEICELIEIEADIAEHQDDALPNDGKRANDVIAKIINGGPQFWCSFEDSVRSIGMKLLDKISNNPSYKPRREVLQGILEPATSLERQQSWIEGYTFHSRTVTVQPNSPAWKTRTAIKNTIKDLLKQDETPYETRLSLWPIFTAAHHSVNQCLEKEPEKFRINLKKEILEDLVWAYKILSPRIDKLEELDSARILWSFHASYNKNPQIRKSAEKLENLYESNALRSEFQGILNQGKPIEENSNAKEKSYILAQQGKLEITKFIQRARSFFGKEEELKGLYDVAWMLGIQADTSSTGSRVQDFISSVLKSSEVTDQTQFAAMIVSSLIARRRKNHPLKAHVLAKELADICGSNAQKIELLMQLYAWVPWPDIFGKPTNKELCFIRSHKKLFIDAERGPEFISCIAWGIHFDWQQLKTMVEHVLDVVKGKQIFDAIERLIHALFCVIYNEKYNKIPLDLGVWMLDQLMRTPTPEYLDVNKEWSIIEILKRTEKPSLTWLPEALKWRRTQESKRGYKNFKALGYHMRLSRFVYSIDEKSEITEEIRNAVQELMKLVFDTGSVGDYLCEILQDMDPHGRVVPEQVVKQFTKVKKLEDKVHLARIGGVFTIDTPAWRTIAEPVLSQAANANTDKEKMILYSALIDKRPRFWSSTPGVVSDIFGVAVDDAHKRIENETDENFRPFWKWRLKIAEAELRNEEERIKEESSE